MGDRSNERTMATRRESLHLMAAGELLRREGHHQQVVLPRPDAFHLLTRRLRNR
ncbi:hypothetical protein GQ55_9G631300 [Panicum hallii var. hallii]|uniref:Uncharacterized protein n=1 Tax=Panicum hallii var. hallii TaxID=1504633 RepID=A0A2T7CI79_9POAL|nr:hypothetical protein GQ55_9G631300 [Panicum hallii var. hallii]